MGHAGDFGDRFLGRCVALADELEGLRATFRLDRSHPQAEAARAGELTGWSVSAKVYRSRTEGAADDRVVWRENCALDHVAATAQPQYAGAGVLVAREHVMVEGPSPTPKLDALREWLATIPERPWSAARRAGTVETSLTYEAWEADVLSVADTASDEDAGRPTDAEPGTASS